MRTMQTLKSLLAALEGRKTYVLAIVALIYLFGGDQGWWKVNEVILGMLGFGGLATLRAAVGRIDGAPEPASTATHIGTSLVPCLLLGLLLCSPGCVTQPGSAPLVTPERVESVTRLAAYGTAKALLIKQPESRAALAQAAAGIHELRAAERWDIAEMGRIAAAHGLDQLNSEEGLLALTGLGLFTDLFTHTQIDLHGNAYAQAVIVGADDGLALALGPAPRAIGGDETLSLLRAAAVATRPSR